MDNVGNQESVKSTHAKLDKTPPTITITSPANTGTYLLNAAVASSYSCADGLSDVATCSGPVPSGANFNTSTVGANTFTVNGSDKAGNTASATNTYNVVYNFSDFLPPLDRASSRTFKLGSTIPIKWQLTDANGTFIGNLGAVVSLKIALNSDCAGGPEGTPFDAGSSGNTRLRYDRDANQYIFNWQTKGLTAGCYNILLTVNDGTTKTTMVQLRP